MIGFGVTICTPPGGMVLPKVVVLGLPVVFVALSEALPVAFPVVLLSPSLEVSVGLEDSLLDPLLDSEGEAEAEVEGVPVADGFSDVFES